MAKKSKRPNKAKSLVAQPLFRSRQEQAKKKRESKVYKNKMKQGIKK